MPYIVTDPAQCKYTDCGSKWCPGIVSTEGENMLVIHPTMTSIAVLRTECPIEPSCDSDPRAEALAEMNREFLLNLAEHHRKKAAPADADDWKDVPNKYAGISATSRAATDRSKLSGIRVRAPR